MANKPVKENSPWSASGLDEFLETTKAEGLHVTREITAAYRYDSGGKEKIRWIENLLGKDGDGKLRISCSIYRNPRNPNVMDENEQVERKIEYKQQISDQTDEQFLHTKQNIAKLLKDCNDSTLWYCFFGASDRSKIAKTDWVGATRKDLESRISTNIKDFGQLIRNLANEKR